MKENEEKEDICNNDFDEWNQQNNGRFGVWINYMEIKPESKLCWI